MLRCPHGHHGKQDLDRLLVGVVVLIVNSRRDPDCYSGSKRDLLVAVAVGAAQASGSVRNIEELSNSVEDRDLCRAFGRHKGVGE